MNETFLTIYKEPDIFNFLLSSFNCFFYFMTFYFFFSIFLLSSGLIKDNSVKTHPALQKYQSFFNNNFYLITFIASLIVTLINYYLGLYINIYGWLIFTILIVILSKINYQRKSMKWISICSVIFIFIVLFIYFGFWTLINVQNHSILADFNIHKYVIVYKDFFSIFYVNDTFFNYIKYTNVDGSELYVNNTIPFKRDLFYYYFLYSISITFWNLIFFKLLKYHKVFNSIRK